MIGFIHDSNKYLYIRDVLQNILGIIDINGNVVVKYDCDAFGNINSITGSKADSLGKYNPFRYKGYYYDEESKMYYCQSRYYVPEWCRWLNADSLSFLEPTVINQMNLFVYCSNNPIAIIDSNGKFGFLATLLIGAAVGGVISGLGTNPVVGIVTGTIGDTVDSFISGESNSVEDGITVFSTSLMTSLISYGIGKGITNKIAKTKINKILSGSNYKVNKRITKLINSGKLKKHPGKVGVVGKSQLYKKLYDGLNYDKLDSFISQITSMLLSPLF